MTWDNRKNTFLFSGKIAFLLGVGILLPSCSQYGSVKNSEIALQRFPVSPRVAAEEITSRGVPFSLHLKLQTTPALLSITRFTNGGERFWIEVATNADFAVALRWVSNTLSIDPFDAYGLKCSGCRLSELDVEGFSQLKILDCHENELTTLNLSNSRELEALVCSKNHLTHLDLSACTNLRALFCATNLLDELDLSGLNRLHTCYASGNNLTNLVLQEGPALRDLRCDENMLTGIIDFRGSPNLWFFSARGNRLSGIIVDNASNRLCRFEYQSK